MKQRLVFAILLIAAVFLPSYSQQPPFWFVMLADPQFGMYTADRSFEQETANYEFAVAAVNRWKPAFVIVLGDLVNKAGDPAQVKEFLRISRTVDPSVPVYFVAGNHDAGNEPSPESLQAYRQAIGRDWYSFRAGPVYGIVLNSTLIKSPQNAMHEYEAQDAWLKKELESAKASKQEHIIIFQHHPLFLSSAQEADQYENIPGLRRRELIDLFRKYGIRHVFAGHTHKNVLARDKDLEVTATGPVGKPLGKDGSGIRVATVTESGLSHRYHDFGMLPAVLRRVSNGSNSESRLHPGDNPDEFDQLLQVVQIDRLH